MAFDNIKLKISQMCVVRVCCSVRGCAITSYGIISFTIASN